jgi:hypothetical protein
VTNQLDEKGEGEGRDVCLRPGMPHDFCDSDSDQEEDSDQDSYDQDSGTGLETLEQLSLEGRRTTWKTEERRMNKGDRGRRRREQ